LPPLMAVQHHLEQVDGINPLQLASTVAYMEQASGVKRSGYSVNIPSTGSEDNTDPTVFVDVTAVNKAAVPNGHLLGALNVRYVVSAFDLVAEGLTLRTTIGNIRIYENEFDMGRVPGEEAVLQGPNRIDIPVLSTGATKVTLAQPWYPGWTATTGGNSVPVQQDGAFSMVAIGDRPKGDFVFEFQPFIVWVGLGLSILGLGLVMYLWRVSP